MAISESLALLEIKALLERIPAVMVAVMMMMTLTAEYHVRTRAVLSTPHLLPHPLSTTPQ